MSTDASGKKRLGTVRSIMRVYPYAKPAMPRIYLGMVAAMIAALVALAIPQVLQSLVDGPLQHGESDEIWLPVIIVLALGVIEAIMIWFRRWFVLQPGTRIEARMRNSLYTQLQDLPVAFHDRWPSGQLLSRAMSDLNLIRRWFSFGLVLLVVNILTILVGIVVLVTINWMLGVLFFVLLDPAVDLRFRVREQVLVDCQAAARTRPATWRPRSRSRCTASGCSRRSGAASTRCRSSPSRRNTCARPRSRRPRRSPASGCGCCSCRTSRSRICLLAGVWFAANGEISVGELVAFFATATVLRWPVESIGFLLSMTFDTRTAADRFFEVMDSKNTITDPEHPKTIDEP